MKKYVVRRQLFQARHSLIAHATMGGHADPNHPKELKEKHNNKKKHNNKRMELLKNSNNYLKW